MSWADLLIDMDVLFAMPAILVAAFFACKTVCFVVNLCRSVDAIARSGSSVATLHRT